MFRAVNWPHPSLVDSHEDGCTEPWIAEAVCALLKAKGGNPTVLETGGFRGTTSAWIALALQQMGGGKLYVADIDLERARGIGERLRGLPIPDVQATAVAADVLEWIPKFKDGTFDFVWIDDDHTKPHVEREIVTLWPKMAPGGIMTFHDVWGVCDLQSVVKKYGGLSLNYPRLGPAGGLGIIQVPA